MSTLKVNNLQVGQDGTAVNNYTLYQPASPDGTVRLGYGVAGSVTDILTLKNSRLGIGTDNPQGKLVVSDGANGLEFNPNSQNAIVSYNRATSAYAPNGLQGSTVSLRIGGVGTALHINSAGNIFIGDNADRTSFLTPTANNLQIDGGVIFEPGSGNDVELYNYRTTAIKIGTGGAENFRISNTGKVYFGNYASAGAKSYILKESSGDYKFNIFASESTTDNRIITVNSRSNVEALRISANAIPRVGINTTGPNALLTVGPVDSPTFYRGTVAIKATNDENSIDTCLYLEEASGAEGWQLSVASNGELNFHNSGASPATLKLGDDDLVTAKALHVTHNITPTSGRGVEIFEAAAGVGQISSFNRTGNSWDELRIKGSEVGIYTGTSNSLGFYLQSTQSTLYGTSDGILNLDSSDGAGAFMRFKHNGTSKTWVGCSEGIGTGGDQDDLGLRAVGNIRLRASSRTLAKFLTSGAVTFHVNSDNHETFRFTTQGSNEAKLIMQDASSNNDIVLNTGGDSWFNGGSLGLNTTTPSEKLHVNLTKSSGSSTADRTKQHAAMRLSLDRTTGSMPYLGWGPALDFYSDNYDGGTQRPNARIAGVVSNYSSGDEGGQLRFYTTPTDTATSESDFVERYRINAIGQITHTGGHQANSGGANVGTGTYNRINAAVAIPTNGSKTLTFTGLQTGWMTIRIGGYGSAGHQAINCMYELGGYMTATYTYDVHVVRQWARFGSISTSKNASNFTITLPNTSNDYVCWAWITIEGNGGNLAVNSN